MHNNIGIAVAAFFLLFIGTTAPIQAQQLNSDFYDIGTITVTDYYVDSTNGNDSNSGLSRNSARQTVSSIWNDIAQNSSLSTGYRINLLPGSYSNDHLPNYWEDRVGTAGAPIILQAADGFGTVFFTRDINMKSVSYFYLLGIDIKNRTTEGYGDAFHCEDCNHILLRGNSFNGAPNGRNGGGDVAHETIKFNQSQHIYIENNNIQGAEDNGIDWVAVQYGHIRSNRIHDTESWCMYVKGGSSYVLVESNLAYNCGEGGITAGQGTGFEYMDSPWIRFEANYIKIVNNIIHDIEGAAIGVNGGYGIFVGYNTAYRIGERSHLLEVVFGERSCDGEVGKCQNNRNLGGWGPVQTGTENNQYIGNRDVIIANNIFYNPVGTHSGYQHFAVYGPRNTSAPGIPSPQKTDTGLVMKGNLIWNGDNSMPLGIEDASEGCQDSNTTCNEAQLLADNIVNTIEPDFIAASSDDFRPVASGLLASQSSASFPNIPAINAGLNPISEGNPSTVMVREFSGAAATLRPPGAFVSSDSATTLPGLVETPSGQNDGASLAVNIRKAKVTARRSGYKFSAKVRVTGSPDAVYAVVTKRGNPVATFTLTEKNNHRYAGGTTASRSVRGKKFRFTITVSNDSDSASARRIARTLAP